jgi:hypothetical protein
VSDKRGLHQPITSDSVCSGDVKLHETKNVSFSLPGLHQLCGPSATEQEDGVVKPWDENCEISTIPEKLH